MLTSNNSVREVYYYFYCFEFIFVQCIKRQSNDIVLKNEDSMNSAWIGIRENSAN